MGRRENPVDHSRPARGRLAEYLRVERHAAGLTYQELAASTGLSPATLKRAASGSVVPKRATVEAFVEGCGGASWAVRDADELWRRARIEERGRLAQLSAPRPELIADAADLSRALEVVWEQAGAPSLRDIRNRSGNLLALPVSSAARIVNRDAVPADVRQLHAFLTGCGIPPEQHAVWSAAFTKISSTPSAPTLQELYQPWAQTPGRPSELQRLLRTAYDSVSVPASPGHERSGDAVYEQASGQVTARLDPVALEEIVADDVQSLLASEALRNGKTPPSPVRSKPDLLTEHDGRFVLFEVKSSRHGDDGPSASSGRGARLPRTPGSGGASSAARARQARTKAAAPFAA
ncbi:helix-turn-helix domain-containing protein [Nocardia asteroides]|uniref:helix-turn-helix domain-containing protein n=1 Tax=Nocardia asteroides TaxID=1824 RepID=UPI0036550398